MAALAGGPWQSDVKLRIHQNLILLETCVLFGLDIWISLDGTMILDFVGWISPD